MIIVRHIVHILYTYTSPVYNIRFIRIFEFESI